MCHQQLVKWTKQCGYMPIEVHQPPKLQSCARRDWGLAWGRMLSHGPPYGRRNNGGQICSWQTAPHLVKLLRYSLEQDSLVCSLVNSGLILAKAHSTLVLWLGAELPSSWISCRQDSGCHHGCIKVYTCHQWACCHLLMEGCVVQQPTLLTGLAGHIKDNHTIMH